VSNTGTGDSGQQSKSRSRDATVHSIRLLPDHPWATRLSVALLIILLLAVPSLIASNYWTRVLVQAGLAVMMALGLNVILGYAGLLNLGYAAFYAVGAYTYAILASSHHGIHLPFLVVFPLAGAVAALVAYLLAVPALSLRGDYLALVTLAFAESLRIFANNFVPLTNGSAGIMEIDHPSIASVTLIHPTHYYYFILAFCIIEVFLLLRLEKSRIGRALTAIREDEDAAKAMGLDTRRLKLIACAIGAVPAGLAGVLFAGMQTFISPESFRFMESVALVSMVFIGGEGSIPGVVIGALLLTTVSEPLRGTALDSARILIYGLLLVLFMVVRPQGLWPASYKPRWTREELERLIKVDLDDPNANQASAA